MQSNTLYKINLVANGATSSVKSPVYTDAPNAMAYHTGDDYMYAVAQKSGQNGQVIRIGSDGGSRAVAGVTVGTTSSITSGTIDPDGYFWVSWLNGQQYAKIDLRIISVGTSDYGTTVLSGTTNLLSLNTQAQYYQINDWAAMGPTSGTGNRNGMLYTVAGQGGQGTSTGYRSLLLTMTTANPPAWAIVQTYTNFNGGTNSGGITGKAEWGAIYPSSDGYLYATENTTGLIYRFNLNSPSTPPELVLQGPAGTTNDGARCVTAPVT